MSFEDSDKAEIERLAREAVASVMAKEEMSFVNERLNILERNRSYGFQGLFGGGSGGGASNSVYEILTDETGAGNTKRKHFTNCYYEVSGVLRAGPDITGSLTSYPNDYIAILLAFGGTDSIVAYQSLSAMQEDMLDQRKVVIPLYKFTSGAVEVDFRHVPRADMWSFGFPGPQSNNPSS